ncbi:MAG TPA: DUF2501 domain-containing protein [Rhodanobacteraceae bacterium]|jgi:hypothetical protein|nr:DUF2501 domain-containing protein [Rhodanobacteraceae bacterium]
MKSNVMLLIAAAAVAGACGSAAAQDMGSLKGLAGDPSKLASGSAGNAAGVVEYCMKNNFLGGDAAGVKDQLMSKVTGGGESEKTDYADGAKGLLKTGDGKSVDIGQLGSMKKSVTKKACASVLDHAKSLL